MAKKETSMRLGRGLAALLGEQAPQLASSQAASIGTQPIRQFSTLPVDLLAPGPFQPRKNMDIERLEDLANSIRSRGVLQPLLVRPDPHKKGHYQIIAGERRWRAAQMAGLHDIPVHNRSLSDSDAMAAAIVENLQRADLNPMEEAEGIHRLIGDYHLTQEELAGAVGKSRSHITNILRLLNLPPLVSQALREGKISAGHGRALLGHPEPLEGLKIILERGLNVRQTELLCRQAQHPLTQNRKKPSPAVEITHLENELAQHLGLRAKITFNGKKGSLKISYDSLEQFEGLLRLLKA